MPDDVPFRCPQCGGEPHKTWGPTHLVMVHWLLNPGLAFNELVLGQRVPKVTHICTSCALDQNQRSYVPCPSCGALHPGMLWSKANGFFHYMGLFCPDCGEKIPAMRNGLALLIEGLTAPLWLLPAALVRERWRDSEIARTRAMQGAEHREVNWIKQGVLVFGGLMYAVFIVLPVILGSVIGAIVALTGLVDWMVVLGYEVEEKPLAPSRFQGARGTSPR